MIWSKGVRARKAWRCGCGHPILPGDLHVRWTASPDDNDVGNANWLTLRECAPCSVRYDRGHLVSLDLAFPVEPARPVAA
jgi:hypothetical protein